MESSLFDFVTVRKECKPFANQILENEKLKIVKSIQFFSFLYCFLKTEIR